MKNFPKLIIVAFCLFAALPFLWHMSSSFKNADEVTNIPPTILPARPTLENYVELFEHRPFLKYWLNSFMIASLSSLLCVGSAAPAAHRLARSSARTRVVATSALLGLAFVPP